MKMNFDYFQVQKWMSLTVRAEKVDEKNGVICLVSMFPSWVMVLKLSKKVLFLQFCPNLSKKPKSVKVIYIYDSKNSHYTLSENDMVYIGLSHRSWEISIINNTILWNFRCIYANCFNGHLLFYCTYFDIYKLWKITFSVVIFLVWIFVR